MDVGKFWKGFQTSEVTLSDLFTQDDSDSCDLGRAWMKEAVTVVHGRQDGSLDQESGYRDKGLDQQRLNRRKRNL